MGATAANRATAALLGQTEQELQMLSRLREAKELVPEIAWRENGAADSIGDLDRLLRRVTMLATRRQAFVADRDVDYQRGIEYGGRPKNGE
jgi:hypothetical protein